MKKLFVGIILSLAAFAAMAMPRPSDIENALAARDYHSAKSMTQEVLRERPDSAKAHLFNAYVLLKADNNVAAAREELKLARQLDKNHSVQNSALFGRTTAELERAVPQRATPVKTYSAPVTTYAQPTYVPYQESALAKFLRFMLWCTIIGLIGYAIWWFFFREKNVVTTCTGHSYSYPSHREVTERPVVRERVTNSGPQSVYNAAPVPVASGGGSHTTVVNNTSHDSGVGNLATGMMLGHMMSNHGSHHDHHHHSHSYNNGEVVDSRFVSAPASYSAPVASTSDYETTRSSFSSSSDSNDSWSTPSRSSSSSSDDSWGSSSSSYSSSSSDYSSSSSSDSWSSSDSSSSSSWD